MWHDDTLGCLDLKQLISRIFTPLHFQPTTVFRERDTVIKTTEDRVQVWPPTAGNRVRVRYSLL
jgi:hypothetical protein